MNVQQLATLMLLPHQTLAYTKYFTARISGGRPTDNLSFRAERDAKRKRQATYLDALIAGTKVEILEGHFLDKKFECKKCGATWAGAEEKMTDVNIATELLVDAFANRFDTAIIVSADSDLVPPVCAVRKWFPHKRVMAAFPPGRFSINLKACANGQRVISKGHLKKSQLPDEIATSGGHVLKRPPSWA